MKWPFPGGKAVRRTGVIALVLVAAASMVAGREKPAPEVLDQALRTLSALLDSLRR